MSGMIGILLFALMAGAWGLDVYDALGEFCSSMEKMTDPSLSEKEQLEAFTDYSKLFTAKIDCSFDPFDEIVGYNLHGVKFDDCMQAENKMIGHLSFVPGIKKATQGKTKCIEKIAD